MSSDARHEQYAITVTVTSSGAAGYRAALGVRQQRKADTRARIAAAAMRLFAERGFDEVRTAEVAAAAGVTEKTVFNHFAAKEDLVYAGDATFESALVDAVRLRGGDVSILDAARTFFLDSYSRCPTDPARRERANVIARLIETSSTLRAREQAILARYSMALSALIRVELGADENDVRPTVAADAILAVHRAVIAGYRRGLLADEPSEWLGRRMQDAAGAAFDLLAAGLPDLDQCGPAVNR
jgi:AcrR family transcriptional regulator